jgi:hypothetical protein
MTIISGSVATRLRGAVLSRLRHAAGLLTCTSSSHVISSSISTDELLLVWHTYVDTNTTPETSYTPAGDTRMRTRHVEVAETATRVDYAQNGRLVARSNCFTV